MCVGAGLGELGVVGLGQVRATILACIRYSGRMHPCSRQVGHHSHEGGISFQVEVVRVPVKSFAQVSWQYNVLS